MLNLGKKKTSIFRPMGPICLTGDLKKNIEHLFYSTAGFVHHFVAICEFKLEFQSENAQIEDKFVLTSVTFFLSLTLTFCMVITIGDGNNSLEFHDATMTGTLWKRCNRQTDRRTDGRGEAFLELVGRSYKLPCTNTLCPRQNSCRFTDDILKFSTFVKIVFFFYSNFSEISCNYQKKTPKQHWFR